MKSLFVIEARQLMDRHVPVDYFDDEPYECHFSLIQFTITESPRII
ncbi:hypothetical protein ACN4GA_30035 [Raoultella terrigena]